MATDALGVNTMRGMGLVPVNPPKATSMVGQGPDSDDEFRVTHFSKGDGGVDLLLQSNRQPKAQIKSSGDRGSNDHRANQQR